MSERQISMMCTKDASNSVLESDHKGAQVVCYAIENHPNDSRIRIDKEGIAQTLSGRMGTGGGQYADGIDGTWCY